MSICLCLSLPYQQGDTKTQPEPIAAPDIRRTLKRQMRKKKERSENIEFLSRWYASLFFLLFSITSLSSLHSVTLSLLSLSYEGAELFDCAEAVSAPPAY